MLQIGACYLHAEAPEEEVGEAEAAREEHDEVQRCRDEERVALFVRQRVDELHLLRGLEQLARERQCEHTPVPAVLYLYVCLYLFMH
jgi:hypothetical protein